MIGDFLRNEGSGTLARFTRDLTADARAGRLEPVRCRDQEVSRLIDILLRHGKNNPTLVGPAGVGKTAVAEGFAQRIAAEAVPLTLRKVPITVTFLPEIDTRGWVEHKMDEHLEELRQAFISVLPEDQQPEELDLAAA